MKHSLAYRIFRKDIGRKIMALLMALLVFAAFEQQTQVTLPVSVRIEYVDAPSGTYDGWVLFVIQGSDPTRPLVVPATSSRPRTMELKLSGTKETVNQLRDSQQRFEFDPTEEGDHPLELSELQKMDAVVDSLREVRIVRPITLRIVVETTREVVLGREHLVLSGKPSSGVRVPGPDDTDALVFRPRTVTLVGAEERLVQVLDPGNPQPLFELDVSDRSGVYESPLTLLPELGDELDVKGRATVQVTFPLDMEPVGEAIRKEVHLIPEVLGLEQNQVLKRHLDQGERLTFKAEEDRTRLIQIFRPRGLQRDTSALLESLAREDALLVAPWHHVDDDLGRIRVALKTLDTFPDGWEVRFAEGESDWINVQWVAGDEQPDRGNGSDDEQ